MKNTNTQQSIASRREAASHDERLLALMQRDFHNGYGRVAEFYWKQLYGVAYHSLYGTGLLHLTEDVVQTTFLSAYRTLETMRRTQPERFRTLHLRAYLYTITRRNAAKLLADGDLTTELLEELHDNPNEMLNPFLGAQAPDPVQSYELKETVAEARLLFQSLSPLQQAILNRRYPPHNPPASDTITYQHIAKELDKPVGTVKSEASRALKQLRRLFAQNGIIASA